MTSQTAKLAIAGAMLGSLIGFLTLARQNAIHAWFNPSMKEGAMTMLVFAALGALGFPLLAYFGRKRPPQ